MEIYVNGSCPENLLEGKQIKMRLNQDLFGRVKQQDCKYNIEFKYIQPGKTTQMLTFKGSTALISRVCWIVIRLKIWMR